jgi:hypothetical protein
MGLLSWMVDKLLTWSDCVPRNPNGYKWSDTEFITWTLLHYFPGPTNSFSMYAALDPKDDGFRGKECVHVPVGVSAFARDPDMVPRRWAETKANVVYWREHEVGGHFAMYERPEEMVQDVVEFVKKVGVLH